MPIFLIPTAFSFAPSASTSKLRSYERQFARSTDTVWCSWKGTRCRQRRVVPACAAWRVHSFRTQHRKRTPIAQTDRRPARFERNGTDRHYRSGGWARIAPAIDRKRTAERAAVAGQGRSRSYPPAWEHHWTFVARFRIQSGSLSGPRHFFRRQRGQFVARPLLRKDGRAGGTQCRRVQRRDAKAGDRELRQTFSRIFGREIGRALRTAEDRSKPRRIRSKRAGSVPKICRSRRQYDDLSRLVSVARTAEDSGELIASRDHRSSSK